jgi:hypothetical protein
MENIQNKFQTSKVLLASKPQLFPIDTKMNVFSNYFRLGVSNYFQLGVSNYFQMAVSNYFSRPHMERPTKLQTTRGCNRRLSRKWPLHEQVTLTVFCKQTNVFRKHYVYLQRRKIGHLPFCQKFCIHWHVKL